MGAPVLASVYGSVEFFSSRIVNFSGYGLEVRFVMMREAFGIFLDSPIWGGNGSLVYDPSIPVHNHAWVLNFLCSYGIVGFALLCGLGYQIVKGASEFRKATYLFLSFIVVVTLYAPPFLYYSIAMSFLYHLGRNSVRWGQVAMVPRESLAGLSAG